MARVTSSLFVSAILRRVQLAGGFAAIIRKGADEAGAVNFVLRDRLGRISLFQPATQSMTGLDREAQRRFILSQSINSEEDLARFTASESRFDPDFWLVELDTGSIDPGDLFEVTTLRD